MNGGTRACMGSAIVARQMEAGVRVWGDETTPAGWMVAGCNGTWRAGRKGSRRSSVETAGADTPPTAAIYKECKCCKIDLGPRNPAQLRGEARSARSAMAWCLAAG